MAATQTGGLTREQVKAELAAARANGELNQFDSLADLNAPVRTRAAVAPAAVASK